MQRLGVERLVGLVAPELGAHPLVQPLGERLGQPVGQRLEQDRAVVVEGGLELLDLGLAAQPGGDGERADVVAQPASTSARRSRPASGAARRGGARSAAAAGAAWCSTSRARLVGVDLDVVAVDRVGREQPEHAGGAQPLLVDDRVEHLLRVVPQLAGGLARRPGC